MKKIKLFVVAMIFLGLIFNVGCGSNKDPNDHIGGVSKGYLTAVAIDVVKEQLKSPSTAQFPTYNFFSFKQVDDKQFIVTGYVDSENSFGAIVRADFEVEVKITDEDHYVLKNFKITEQ